MTATAPRDAGMLAAEYALGVLPAAERVDFARRLERDTALRSRVWQWEIGLSGLADGIAEVAPPAQLKAAVMDRLFKPRPRASLWNSLLLWRGASAGLLAALAVVAGLYLRAPVAPTGSGPMLLAEVASADASVRVIALYDTQTGALRLDRRAGERAPGRDMELWLIDGTQPPKPLGLMPVAATGVIEVPAALRPAVAHAVLAVSDEPAGGSPTGLPTGAVLATGKVHSF